MLPKVHFVSGRKLHRRTVLRGAGIAMGLPWLSAMERACGRAVTPAPKRFVAMTLGLGLVGENLFPEAAGQDYQPSPYLKPLQDLRDRFTIISGTSHPGVNNGHRAEASILTATPIGNGQARNTISIDQLLAKHAGPVTRFPSLVLGTGGADSPSYTENGAMIPALTSPSALFTQLFVDDSEAERQRQAERVQQGRSIMDIVAEDAKSLQRELGRGDQQRLDAYFSSVRDLEKRMSESERWAHLPKPVVDAPLPRDVADDNDLVARQKTMQDVIRLALKTDSSRFITFHTGGAGGVVPVEGVKEGYHSLSHHGKDEDKLAQLALVELAMLQQWGDFLRDLAATSEAEGSLLDNTTVLLTSNLGNASNHSNQNMPVLLAGGAFRHGTHLAFSRDNNYPLPNLYVSILQQLGLAVDRFASSTGTMDGIVVQSSPA
jgi:hypothetical protein